MENYSRPISNSIAIKLESHSDQSNTTEVSTTLNNINQNKRVQAAPQKPIDVKYYQLSHGWKKRFVRRLTGINRDKEKFDCYLFPPITYGQTIRSAQDLLKFLKEHPECPIDPFQVNTDNPEKYSDGRVSSTTMKLIKDIQELQLLRPLNSASNMETVRSMPIIFQNDEPNIAQTNFVNLNDFSNPTSPQILVNSIFKDNSASKNDSMDCSFENNQEHYTFQPKINSDVNFKCLKCDKIFVGFDSFFLHTNQHWMDERNICPICNVYIMNNFQIHFHSHLPIESILTNKNDIKSISQQNDESQYPFSFKPDAKDSYETTKDLMIPHKPQQTQRIYLKQVVNEEEIIADYYNEADKIISEHGTVRCKEEAENCLGSTTAKFLLSKLDKESRDVVSSVVMTYPDLWQHGFGVFCSSSKKVGLR